MCTYLNNVYFNAKYKKKILKTGAQKDRSRRSAERTEAAFKLERDIHLSLSLPSLVQLFDTDEDERITREEFAALLRSALGVSDMNMTKLFKDIDADASGFITFSE